MHRNKIYGFVIFLSFFSCSLDYGTLGSEEDVLSNETPNAVLSEFVHTAIDNGSPLFRMEAKRAEQYDGLNEVRLFGVRFSEYDPNSSKIITSGFADTARYFTDSENAELSGNLRLDSKREDLNVEGGYLFWNKSDRMLVSRSDQVILLSRSNGTEIRGEGLKVDTATKSFSFSGRVEGTWVIDTK